jgi:hypothetical protein
MQQCKYLNIYVSHKVKCGDVNTLKCKHMVILNANGNVKSTRNRQKYKKYHKYTEMLKVHKQISVESVTNFAMSNTQWHTQICCTFIILFVMQKSVINIMDMFCKLCKMEEKKARSTKKCGNFEKFGEF